MGYIGAIVAVATIGGFLFGFDSGVINGTVDGLTAGLPVQHGRTRLRGRLDAARLRDRRVLRRTPGRPLGSSPVLIISAVLFLLSAIGAGPCNRSGFFVVARVLGGFAVGAASVMSPAYIAEVAPARYRGRLATVQQIAIIGGLFCAFLSNFLLAKAAGASTERAVARAGGVALDVLDAGDPVAAVPGAAAVHSGKPALPGGEGAQGRCARRADPPVRRGAGADQAGRDRCLAVGGSSPPAAVAT